MFDCWSIKSCDRRLLNSRKVTFTQILYETKLRFVFFLWILVRRPTEKKVFVFVNSRTLTQLNCPKQRDVLLRLSPIFTPTSAICCSPTNVWCQVRAVSCYAAALAACVTCNCTTWHIDPIFTQHPFINVVPRPWAMCLHATANLNTWPIYSLIPQVHSQQQIENEHNCDDIYYHDGGYIPNGRYIPIDISQGKFITVRVKACWRAKMSAMQRKVSHFLVSMRVGLTKISKTH